MKIMLVEDTQLKAERISTFLAREYRNAEVILEKSYQAALTRLDREKVDLILLDMTIPTFDATARARYGRPRPLGGYEIMRKMNRRRIVADVIIVTQLEHFGDAEQQITFPQVKELCRKEFPSLFKGAVFFSQSDNSWETELKHLIVFDGESA